jgi:hypothetical protein
MILVRNVFRLKFGKAREAIALCQEGLSVIRRSGMPGEARLLTDLTGPFYTLVLEMTHDSLADMEREARQEMGDQEWRAWYQRFVPLVESGYREMFTIVGSAPGQSTVGARGEAAPAGAGT